MRQWLKPLVVVATDARSEFINFFPPSQPGTALPTSEDFWEAIAEELAGLSP